MKTKFCLACLTGLSLLALAGPLQATTTNTVTLTVSPKGAGEVTGEGKYPEGTNVIVTATADDCYTFDYWEVGGKKYVNNPLSFIPPASVSLTAVFTQIKYPISTSSLPENGGTVTGGGNIGCGVTNTVTAKANTADGFAFSLWTSTLEGPSTNSKITFTVSGPESFVAHFNDVKPPTIAITAPAENETIPSSAFVIKGTAKDNVAVASVSFSLNGGAPQAASSSNGFATWYAYVTLPPNSTNTVTAFAVDTSGNTSADTKPITFKCTAAGYAPLSIAGQLATVSSTSSGGADPSFQVSFDSAVYVMTSSSITNGGEVGTYTYTPTGPDTAELAPHHVLPVQGSGTNSENVLELTFTNAYDATYTETGGGSGSVTLIPAAESVPASLDGVELIQTSTATLNLVSSNVFALGTFTESNSLAESLLGSYTFTQFTPVGALLIETSDTTTNFVLLSFTTGVTPPSGTYVSAYVVSSNAVTADVGTFTTSSSVVTNKLVGPGSLYGLQAKITPILPKGETVYSFTRTFGRGTFASMFIPPGTNYSLFTNAPNDVGIHLSNLHVTDDTGTSAIMAVAPPYAVGLDDYSVDEIWKSATSGVSSNLVTGETATLSFSIVKNNAPAALTGQEITAKLTGNNTPGTITFNYNNFVGGGGLAGVFGTYTYAPYTPTMALVQLTATDSADAGEVQYIQLNFESANSGAFVYSRFAGEWELRPGTFSIKPAP
jgi:Divergent InlB B-repeat domain/Bacterial Ig domain